MTRAVRSGGDIHKEDGSYGAISDHLRNHAHLTNCIHLKNLMHRHSPVLADRSLARDLVILQRSRSLRDPSTSPPSWLSPSVLDALANNRAGSSGRRSVGAERQRDISRLFASSPRNSGLATSKVAAEESVRDHHIVECRDKDVEESIGAEHRRKHRKSSVSGGNMNSPRERKGSQKSIHGRKSQLKTLSEQLDEVPNRTDIDTGRPSRNCQHGRRAAGEEKILEEEPEASGHILGNGLNRTKKKQRSRGSRRARRPKDSRGAAGVHSNLSAASNSFAQCSAHHARRIGDIREEAEVDVTQDPRNGCGIPWNWSRIHHRGKTFLDKAGRSLSCGLSDSRLRQAEAQGDDSNMPIGSDHLASSTNSDSEALPLLMEPSGSHESLGNGFPAQDYSGELGIYANHGLRHERDSDFASETRAGNLQRFRRRCPGRHLSLTQKYMPKTFKDLVGQNLVVQALSNTVLRRRVGLIYVFYGPHGTGKTSCARVFAKALNCQSVEHPRPCDVCRSCISHNLGKSKNVLEVGSVGNFDYEAVLDILDSMLLSSLSAQYRVVIVDGCDTLPPDCWNAISKVINRATRHVVFILISSTLDHLPHIIISRCQKFFFPKLKDVDIISTLQWISTSEGLEIDKDALKLIASKSDGSLRDAEMTLDQLSLLGQKITLPLVQELVGSVSDEKLVDLLDFALSADTVNTVKNLREIMETGAEPLALMSQIATIITDILAGSYVFTRERLRQKFFRRSTLSKEDMEKLRQALKTLSEAEKQLRMSNDKLTWLTSALLQLAPDQQYILPTSSTDTSFNHSPMLINNSVQGNMPSNSTNEEVGVLARDRSLPRATGLQNFSHGDAYAAGHVNKMISSYTSRKGQLEDTPQTLTLCTEAIKDNKGYKYRRSHKNTEKLWQEVLENIQPDALRHFLYQEGKLNSVIFGPAPTVQLSVRSYASKSKAEKFRGQILQAIEYVLNSSVILEIRCESKKDVRPDTKGIGSSNGRRLHSDPIEMAKNEIVETVASAREHEHIDLTDKLELKKKGMGNVWVEGTSSSHHQGDLVPLPERREGEEQLRRQALVRSKVSLAHVIQQAEGTQGGVWSRRKAMSIAEKLEQENLRLEPRSRTLLCWRASRIARGKLPRLRIRTRKPDSLLKLVTCGRCLSSRSPRHVLSNNKGRRLSSSQLRKKRLVLQGLVCG